MSELSTPVQGDHNVRVGFHLVNTTLSDQDKEEGMELVQVVSYDDDHIVLTDPRKKKTEQFAFDYIVDEDGDKEGQEDVKNDVLANLVNDAANGINSLLLFVGSDDEFFRQMVNRSGKLLWNLLESREGEPFSVRMSLIAAPNGSGVYDLTASPSKDSKAVGIKITKEITVSEGQLQEVASFDVFQELCKNAWDHAAKELIADDAKLDTCIDIRIKTEQHSGLFRLYQMHERLTSGKDKGRLESLVTRERNGKFGKGHPVPTFVRHGLGGSADCVVLGQLFKSTKVPSSNDKKKPSAGSIGNFTFDHHMLSTLIQLQSIKNKLTHHGGENARSAAGSSSSSGGGGGKGKAKASSSAASSPKSPKKVNSMASVAKAAKKLKKGSKKDKKEKKTDKKGKGKADKKGKKSDKKSTKSSGKKSGKKGKK
eukprot:TRINITY_DN4548_c1_g1_i1.p1 TRINITY_DN4548_c1_g1~~TRINITY_DN4548_c1_g1_i1.p1  ORF type:complete len:425 (+),score=174.87 TRINITY_DN4548_c1_g1_i1:422-1696(+)